MIVPEYWAEARRTAQLGTKAINLHRFGWSNISPEDAQAMAEARVEEASARLRAGETLPRRELKLPYNGSEGVPIREEVLARHGEVVITRNAYGAHCLNTEQALFADIDFTPEFSLKSGLLGFALLNFLNLLLALQLRSSGVFLLCMLVSMPFSAAAARQVESLLVGLRGGRLHLVRQRMLAFLSTPPRLEPAPVSDAGRPACARHSTALGSALGRGAGLLPGRCNRPCLCAHVPAPKLLSRSPECQALAHRHFELDATTPRRLAGEPRKAAHSFRLD